MRSHKKVGWWSPNTYEILNEITLERYLQVRRDLSWTIRSGTVLTLWAQIHNDRSEYGLVPIGEVPA